MKGDAAMGSKDAQAEGNLSQLKGFFQENTIPTGPSYGNNFFFTVGIYLLELFVMLGATGMLMAVFGPYWWDMSAIGTFVRSVHLWAAEAFVTLIFVHLFVNFATSAFKKKKLVWMIGATMLALVLFEFAFGVGMGGNLIAQANQQAGSDLWNGMGLGFWINPMNSGAVMGWHMAIIPLLLVMLMFLHYGLVKRKGLNTPYRKDVPYSMVKIDHKTIYKRMLYMPILVVILALLFSAPYIPPLTISSVAHAQPGVIAATFLSEFNGSSATATYLDTINPYTFNTTRVYVSIPYSAYLSLTHSNNAEAALLSESASARNAHVSQAVTYFTNNGSISAGMNSTNPAIVLASTLTYMAQTGTYQPILQNEVQSGLDTTYVIRFLYDSGALWEQASKYGLSVPQWGMLEVGAPPWSLQYWLIPYNMLQIETGGIPWWNDIENGTIGMLSLLVLIFLPYIPILRDIPDKLKLHKLFWNRFTIPEMKKNGDKKDRV